MAKRHPAVMRAEEAEGVSRIVDDHGNCSLCAGTHYGTGYFYCPYACSRCRVNTDVCKVADCPRTAQTIPEERNGNAL